MQYTIISLMKKHEYFMLQKSLKKSVLVLWQNQKNTEKMTFEYDLGNFVYDSI